MPRGTELSESQSLTNLLRNGGFEEWGASAPAYWTLAGAGATAAEDASTFYVGTQSALLTRTGADAALTQNVVGQSLALGYVRGKPFTFSARVRPGASGVKAIIGLTDGVRAVWSGYPTETGAFSLVHVTLVVDNTATKLEAACKVQGAAGTGRFDACMLTEGYAVPAFAPNPADFRDPQNSDTTAPDTPTGLSATAKTLAIQLTWNPNTESDIQQYELQRATDAGFTAGVTTLILYASSYLDQTGDTTTYYYRVRAVRLSRAASAWSAAVSRAANPLSGEPTTILFSATDRILGRQSAGAGAGEEIPCTAAGRALLDDADAAAQRATLGLGSLATQNANAVAIAGGTIRDAFLKLKAGSYTPGTTTPSVAAVNLLALSNVAPTTITDFLGGEAGQPLLLTFANGNTTIARSGSVYLAGGADFVGSAHDTLLLVSADAAWHEVARAVSA